MIYKHKNKIIKLSLILIFSIIMYSAFLWPTPKYFSKAIPYTSYGNSKITRNLVQGDHLQLQYHFDLASQMLRGEIPFFYNVYEFNLGSDDDRKFIDTYYIPYSLIYSASRVFMSDAAAWNFTQFSAVFFGFLFIYILAYRYTRNTITSLYIAIISTSLPYRWLNLSGGSPTGFGMSIIPAYALGIDIAIRDKRIKGGIISAISIFLLYSSDLHCFVFSVIATPIFCIISWLTWEKPFLELKKNLLSLIKTLSPIPIMVLGIFFLASHLRSMYATTDVADGRTLSELAVHSPKIQAIIDPHYNCYAAHHFNIGPVLFILIATTLIFFVAYTIKSFIKKDSVNTKKGLIRYPLSTLVAGIFLIGCFMLALGTNGPFDALPIKLARKIIPNFNMIRQPVKVYCLLPTILTLLFASCFTFESIKRRISLCHGTACVFALLCIIYSVNMSTEVTLLPPHNEAYQAASKIKHNYDNPRALILPIWPGDSAWSSIYEYNAIRSKLRMLNGYSPVKTENYTKDVFENYETTTQGILSQHNINTLKDFKVSSIILHEDAFPEKVSPLPVGYTIRKLNANPNLKLIAQDDSTYSYEILNSPRETNDDNFINISAICPSRVWYFNKKAPYTDLNDFNDGIQLTIRKPAISSTSEENWLTNEEREKITKSSLAVDNAIDNCKIGYWIVKASKPNNLLFNGEKGVVLKTVNNEELPVIAFPALDINSKGFSEVTISGDTHIIAAAFMPVLDSITTLSRSIDAVDLFHSGYSTFENNTSSYVTITPQNSPADEILYGPNLPISEGSWTASFEIIDKKVIPGQINAYLNGKLVASTTNSNSISFSTTSGDFVSIKYKYDGSDIVKIKKLIFTKQ